MRRIPHVVVAVVGAGAMVGSLFSGALASQPPLRPLAHTHATKNYTVTGNLTITGVLKVKKNASVYGRTYAHGGEQIWQGLQINSGGIKTDSLSVTGPSQFAGQSAFQNNVTVAGTLQAAGPITGTSLALSGAATVGGTLTVNDKITGGAAGITTAGPVSAGSLSTGTLTASGALAAPSISTGSITSTGGLSILGPVDFSHATVTGLTAGTPATGTGTFSTLAVGNTGGSSAPLTVMANGKSTTVGVNTGGALTVGDLAASGGISAAGNATVGGNLTVSGTGGVTTSILQAPSTSSAGTTTQQALTIQGNGINLNGNTTLANGADLDLSAPSGTTGASHVNANGDTDVAGFVTVIGSTAGSTTVTAGHEVAVPFTFRQAYTNKPIVTVTAAGDPAPGVNTAPKVWVTYTTSLSGTPTTYTGFTIHYVNQSDVTVSSSAPVIYQYHVIGL